MIERLHNSERQSMPRNFEEKILWYIESALHSPRYKLILIASGLDPGCQQVIVNAAGTSLRSSKGCETLNSHHTETNIAQVYSLL